MKKFLTAESVCAGHPDKVCDYISDKIVDACLRKDKAARVAVETMATKGHIIVAGEITCDGKINIRDIVRLALFELGYNPYTFLIYVYVHKQSEDISKGVTKSLEARNGDKSWYSNIGAGDQGSVIGYACNETKSGIPLPLDLAHKICKRIDKCRNEKTIKGIKPDGKCQVTIEYEDDIPKRVDTIVISVQHDKNKRISELRDEIISNVLWNVFEEFPFDEQTKILVNPSGKFVKGGPSADTGLTGRKIMVDTYGGLVSHGGGAFSGKDPTKVDRSGAYMARYIAKNIVNAEFAKRCQVTISYAIGKAEPVAVEVNTFGTGIISDDKLVDIVKEVFNMKPAAIIEQLNLRNQYYSDVAHYGHFGNRYKDWEITDKFKELREAIEKYE